MVLGLIAALLATLKALEQRKELVTKMGEWLLHQNVVATKPNFT